MNRLSILASLAAVLFFSSARAGDDSLLVVDSPMSPPEWALLERELLRANTDACQEFFAKYFDERGWLLLGREWVAQADAELRDQRLAAGNALRLAEELIKKRIYTAAREQLEQILTSFQSAAVGDLALTEILARAEELLRSIQPADEPSPGPTAAPETPTPAAEPGTDQ